MTRTRVTAAFAALLFVCGLTVSAEAQDRLTIGEWEVVASGSGFGATVGQAGALGGLLADGGRYGLLYDRLIDRVTGAEVEYWVSRGLAPIAADPARPRGFFAQYPPSTFSGATGVVMADLRTGVITPLLSLPAPAVLPIGAVYAVDAQRLVVTYPAANGSSYEWAVVDLAGGAPAVRVMPSSLPAYVGTAWAVSPDGARFYRAATDPLTHEFLLLAYDVTTGAEIGRVVRPPAFGITLTWSDGLDGLIENRDNTFSAITAALQVAGSVAVPVSGKCGTQVTVSPSSGRVYSFTGGGTYFGVPFFATLSGMPLGASGPVDQSDVAPEVKSVCGGLRVAAPPGATRRLQASVVGDTVSFAWENVGGASRFTLEAGMTPGRTDVSFALGPDSRWALAGVPRGRYYVRVRGANTFGNGTASAEVQVVVP